MVQGFLCKEASNNPLAELIYNCSPDRCEKIVDIPMHHCKCNLAYFRSCMYVCIMLCKVPRIRMWGNSNACNALYSAARTKVLIFSFVKFLHWVANQNLNQLPRNC